MDTQLKIFALEYVKFHDNLLKEEKLAIGEFIMEANDDQVKFMLSTGEVKDKLTEEDLNFLKDKSLFIDEFEGQWMSAKDQAGQVGQSLSSAMWAAAAVVLAVKAYKRFFSQAAKACGGRSGVEKTSCINKFKRKAQEAKVKSLESGMSKCSKTKDPASCKSKIQGQINKEKAKLGAL